MSFLTALSGLNAAQTEISSTSNNIANVDATGYHKTRVEISLSREELFYRKIF